MEFKRYEHIDDMPLFNWRKVQEDQDYRYTRLEDIYKGEEEPEDYLAWDKVYESFLETFGVSEYYTRILELRLQKAIAQCDLVITEDRSHNNFIKRYDREITELMNRDNDMTLGDCISYVSKWQGYPVQQKKTTVREFYETLETMKKEANKQKEQAQKKK